MRLALFSLLMVLWSGLALAQDQTTQPTPDQAPAADQAPAPMATADDTEKRVLVIGDQLAGPMGNGLGRVIQNDDTANFAMFNRSNEGTGLARPEIYDWAAAIPKIVQDKNFSAAVVLIGINDRRDMRDASGATLKFGTPEWDTLYKARIDAVMDAFAAANIKVFWLGEPPMGDPALDADLQNITALIKERTEAKGGVFIDLRAPLLNTSGGYTDRGPDDTGADRRLREGDGVTFMKAGNNRLGLIVLTALKAGAAAPVPPVSPAAPPAVAPADVPAAQAPVAAASPPVDEQEGPIFGQEGVDNDTAANNSKVLTAGVEKDKAVQQAASASIIGIAAAKGSNAEALFTKGLAGPAPAGRFDDFSAKAN